MKTQPTLSRTVALAAVLVVTPLTAKAQTASSPPTLPNAFFTSGVNKINSTGTYYSDGSYSPITDYNLVGVGGNNTILNFATGASAETVIETSGGSDFLHVTGGTIGGIDVGVNNVATLDGGTFTEADARNNSILNVDYGHYDNVAGGDNSIINVRGGDISYLLVGQSSTINVYGENLAINGDMITGILENGATLDAQITKGGNYNLIPAVANVPEASSMVSFGMLLLLGGAGLVWRKKRGVSPPRPQ